MIAGLLIPADLLLPARVLEIPERSTLPIGASVNELADMLGAVRVEHARLAADAVFFIAAPHTLRDGDARPNRRMTNLRDAEVLLTLRKRSPYAVAGDALVLGNGGPRAGLSDVPDRILADADRAGWLGRTGDKH